MESVPRRHALILLLLSALVLAAYSNSFTAGFTFDNASLILNDPRVHSVSLLHLREILLHTYWWPKLETGLFRPVTTLSYLFNYAVLGAAATPAAYHVFNLLLHAANAFLVYLLILDLARRRRPAIFAAALWALHPVCTEAVTNIIGRSDEFAALGVLGALLFYIRASRETGRAKARSLNAMMAFAALAVFSKESGVMIAALIPLYDFSFRIPRRSSLRETAARLRQFAWDAYLDLAIPLVAMLGARWVILRHSRVMEISFVDNPLVDAGLATRSATAIRLAGEYLRLLVWPRTLSLDYSYNQLPPLTWHSAAWSDAAAAVAVVALLAAAAFSWRKRPTIFFLIGFSALTLLPAANLLVTTGTILAERLLYLPAVGFAAALALGVDALARRAGLRPLAAALALSAVCLAYGARTWRRNFDWRDDATLFASAVEAAPASFKTHLGLANALTAAEPDRAIAEAEKAAAIVDSLPDSLNSTRVYVLLAAVYGARGDSLGGRDSEWYRKALAAALRAVAIDRAQNENYRRAELARGTPPEQITLAGLPDAYSALGTAYLRLGQSANAIEAFQYQRRLAPGVPLADSNLASAYLAANQPEQAATELLDAFLLNPSPLALDRVAALYRKIAGGNCSIAQQGDQRSLNPECPIVRRDLCAGYRELAVAFREARLGDPAGLVPAARGLDIACR